MSIDSECQLFRVLLIDLHQKIARSVYNRRKRYLFEFQEQICQQLVKLFNEFEDCFIVDSMPLKVCKLSRASRSKICREEFEINPHKGFCASQSMYYYGCKLHAVCSVNGVIK